MSSLNPKKQLVAAIDLLEDDLNIFFKNRLAEIKKKYLKTSGPEASENYDKNMTSWGWHMKVPIRARLLKMQNNQPEFFDYISEKKSKNQPVKLLDLGAGFCSYWPIFQNLGITSFCGIDQYDSRRWEIFLETFLFNSFRAHDLINFLTSPPGVPIQTVYHPLRDEDSALRSLTTVRNNCIQCYYEGNQEYFESAKRVIKKFKINNGRLIQGSVFDIDFFLGEDDEKSFDLISINYPGPADPKKGNLGISRKVFDSVVEKYLKKDGVASFNNL
tara:strand:+ start:86 stop:904 length:819 start_codon:yes stop_codon:yes gene_type:complete